MNADLTSLGEKGFLASILPGLYVDPMLVGGFGHDASVIELRDAPFNLICKIDRASRPVSLTRGWSGHRTWGRMAITANCSDILASGGRPIACMLAIMTPGHERTSNVRDVILGAADECRAHNVVYAGGDTKEAGETHVVGMAVGVIDKDGFLPRNTAAPGDLLYCAGSVGGFGGAYFLLENVPAAQRDHPTASYVEYLAEPVAQWHVASEVNARKGARCGMDASDGILDVLQTFSSAGVRVVLDLEHVPYHEFATECARKTAIPLTQLIFSGGDWNILYCVPAKYSVELDDIPGLFRIGEVTSGNGVVARDHTGTEFDVRGVVNEHFKNRIEDAGSFMESIENGNFIQ